MTPARNITEQNGGRLMTNKTMAHETGVVLGVRRPANQSQWPHRLLRKRLSKSWNISREPVRRSDHVELMGRTITFRRQEVSCGR
jgi:hypothetical protein